MEYVNRQDGSRISYAEFGLPDGLPFLYCHGFPASCTEAQLIDDAAKKLGARIIAPDRPGYGETDFLPVNDYFDWVDDVQLLIEKLDLKRFVVLGISGGAPYAFAISQKFSSQVIRTGIVCGVGSLSKKESAEGMGLFARLSLGLARNKPAIARLLYSSLMARAIKYFPHLAIRILTGNSPKADHEVLSQSKVNRIIINSVKRAFIQGGRAAAQDLLLMVKPWEISLQEIKNPVYLWHGELDTTVPSDFTRYHATLLPDCRAYYYPQEGHFSLPVRYMNEIIDALMNAAGK
jgi:pimeloyl-ACP methyl ester carboxylesterase